MSTLSPFVDDNEINAEVIQNSPLDLYFNEDPTGPQVQQPAIPLNIEMEQFSRLDLIHNCWKIILNSDLLVTPNTTYYERLHLVPLPLRDRPLRVLDIGAASGIWAVELARRNPGIQVVGLEVTEIRLPPGTVVPNLTFELCPQGNGIEGADWASLEERYGKFDFIHFRTLIGSVTNWSTLLQNAYNLLEYGGVIEIQEGYLTAPETVDESFDNTNVQRYFNYLREAGRRLGIQNDILPDLARLVNGIGFTYVVENKENCPIGAWVDPDLATPFNGTGELLHRLGNFAREATIIGAREYGRRALIRTLGQTEQEAHAFIESVVASLRSGNIHIYYRTFIIHGRKPYPNEASHSTSSDSKQPNETKHNHFRPDGKHPAP